MADVTFSKRNPKELLVADYDQIAAALKDESGTQDADSVAAKVAKRISGNSPISLNAKGEKLAKRLGELGGTVPPQADRGPAPLASLLKADIARWSPILKAAAEKMN